MANYKMLVFTNPVAGQDDEYNHWYNHQHLQDVTAVPGFVSAQRFKLRNPAGFEHAWQYCAIYEMETDDPDAAMAHLLSLRGGEAMMISEALDLDGAVAGIFEPCSEVVRTSLPAHASHG